MKKNIEAFARYHQVKESLAEYTQIGMAGIQLLRLNVSVPNGARLLGGFVDACDIAHWSEARTFPDPVGKVSQIGDMLCHHVIVQQVAAFDLFTRAVVSDLARFSGWARSSRSELSHSHALSVLSTQGRWVVSPCCYELENKVGDLINRLSDLEHLIGWTPSKKLRSITPLFHLARMCRNRIVHSDGLVGSELSEYCQSEEVRGALTEYRKHYSRADLPQLPHWQRGHALRLAPTNSIFFGAVLYEFAKEINAYVCSKLTQKEYVEMAFFYSCLVETHQARTIKHRDAGARIAHFLASRYLFSETSSIGEISAHLKERALGKKGKSEVETTLWKIALERHEALHLQESTKTSDQEVPTHVLPKTTVNPIAGKRGASKRAASRGRRLPSR